MATPQRQFTFELTRRSIEGATDLEALKKLALEMLNHNKALQEYVETLLLEPFKSKEKDNE